MGVRRSARSVVYDVQVRKEENFHRNLCVNLLDAVLNIHPFSTEPSSDFMVIHASAKFTQRLKCEVSLPNRKHFQSVKVDAWSGDIMRVYGVGDCALMMNDASFSIVVIPLKGLTFETFLQVFLQRAARLFIQAGGVLETQNQTVVVLRRTDRSLIGSMNSAKQDALYEIQAQLENEMIDWDQVEDRLNEIPFSAIGYSSPKQELVRVLDSPLY
jgi:hypothetical protein